jgi:hypothetical protein
VYSEVRRKNALLRFHFNVDPDKLTDEEWALYWADLEFVLSDKDEKGKKVFYKR